MTAARGQRHRPAIGAGISGRAVFVNDAPDEERAHPHFYCDAATLVALFSGFELLGLSQEVQRKPGSWHWNVVAERLPG